MKYFLAVALCSLITVGGNSQSISPKMIQPKDVYRMKQVRQPKVSPDGKWVLYSLSQVDSSKDRNASKLYMVDIDGKETICLTEQTKNPGSHDWSPDGKYISFLTIYQTKESGFSSIEQRNLDAIIWDKFALNPSHEIWTELKINSFPNYLLLDKNLILLASPALAPSPNGKYETIEKTMYDIKRSAENR